MWDWLLRSIQGKSAYSNIYQISEFELLLLWYSPSSTNDIVKNLTVIYEFTVYGKTNFKNGCTNIFY